MRVAFIATCCAAAVAVATPIAAQGPVRQGLRRTGEIAVEGTRRVVRGTGEVARGVVGGAADVTRGVVRGAARGVGALTPGLPLQARAGANLQAGDLGRDARWRFQQHNGEWWYYSPENRWMYHRDGQWNEFAHDSFQPNPQFAEGAIAGNPYSGEYSAGFRGAEGEGAQADPYAQGGDPSQAGQAHVFYDRCGRAYICDNGHRVYLHQEQGGAQPYSAGYGGAEGQYGDQSEWSPTPATPDEAGVNTGGDGSGDAGQAPGVDGATAPRELNNEPPSPGVSGDPPTGGEAAR